MKYIPLVVAAAILSAAPVCADGGSVPAQGTERPLKVLMIGNSFSISCTRQLPQVAWANGHRLDLASLFIGGCSLERHWRNVEAAATNAAFRPYRFDRFVDGRCVVEKGAANIPDALAMDKWDVVTLQQSSHFSWDPATYQPWGDNLVAKIRALAPQAKILVQETWSYPPWDRRLGKFGFDQVEMYARLHDAYGAFAKKYGFGIIPVGTAAEICADRNALFTKPDFHFNHGEGEYLQALVWDLSLFGPKAGGACAYRPQGMSAERAGELADAADAAVARVRDASAYADRVFRDARVTRGNTNILKIQPIDDEVSVARHFRIKAEFYPVEDGRLEISSDEEIRIILFKEPDARRPRKCDIYYYQWSGFDNRGNPTNRRTGFCHLYDGGIEEAFKGTAYEPVSRIFGEFARAGLKMDYNTMMIGAENRPYVSLLEMLFRGRFHNLLKEESTMISWWSGDLPCWKMRCGRRRCCATVWRRFRACG